MTRNGSLLTFFNQPKPSLVPLTISTVPVQPVQSLALAQEKEPNSKSATVSLGDGQPQAPIITQPRVSLFSVAAALSWYFGILVNKFCKIMKIFE